VTPRIGICDYGVGNVRSVARALAAAGADVLLSDDCAALDACDGLILPGVGAFDAAAFRLQESGLGDAVRAVATSGRPVLGVCLGHQLLFEHSDEGARPGLGLVRGHVRRLDPANGKVPHMGWNRLGIVRQSRLLEGTADGSYVYFVHSYVADATGMDVVAVAERGGEEFPAVVESRNVIGTQFHPEKSGGVGLRIYANFAALCAASPAIDTWAS